VSYLEENKDYYYYYCYYTRLDLIHTRLKSHPLSTRCHPDSARSHTRRLDLITIFGTEAKQPEINPRDQKNAVNYKKLYLIQKNKIVIVVHGISRSTLPYLLNFKLFSSLLCLFWSTNLALALKLFCNQNSVGPKYQLSGNSATQLTFSSANDKATSVLSPITFCTVGVSSA
jgi:hypothetical protein